MEINDIDNYSTIQKMVVCVAMRDEVEDKDGNFGDGRFIDVFVETEINRNICGSGAEIIDIMINENGDCPKDEQEEKEIIEFVKNNLK